MSSMNLTFDDFYPKGDSHFSVIILKVSKSTEDRIKLISLSL